MSKLKPCPACGKDVAKGAKSCPSCGKKLKSPFLTRLVILVIVVGVLGAISTGLEGAESGSTSIKEAKIGEVFNYDGFDVTIIKVTKDRVIGGSGVVLAQASDGASYVNVLWTYKNTTSSPKSSWSTPSIALISPDGAKYTQDAMASGMLAVVFDAGEKVLSDINPQVTIKAATSFEVADSLLKSDGWVLQVGNVKIPVRY